MNDTERPKTVIPKTERHGQPWTEQEERELYDAFVEGRTLAFISKKHGRTRGSIGGHLTKLGLLDEDGAKVTPAPEFTPTLAAQNRKHKTETKTAIRAKFNVESEVTAVLSTEMNERFKEALSVMEDTYKNVFITGKAGTGKSTLLSYFCANTDKKPVVLAPTGVAALNVKGQTIHSFFNFYTDVTPQSIRARKTKPRDTKLYKKLKTIIIDEVSMLRADMLDCIDEFLRLYGPHEDLPFGGVQMIFIGDLYQLPPVVKKEEQEIFQTHYTSEYFFSAHALADNPPEIIELQKVYRQKDQTFVDLLNKIRSNTMRESDVKLLNSRYGIPEPDTKEGRFITLTTTNAKADEINNAELIALKGRIHKSKAETEGDFTKEYFPTAPELTFKTGAQVMMLNNDSERRWVNGSIGVIESVEHDAEGEEYLMIRLADTRKRVEVRRHSWAVYRSGLEDGALVTVPVGTFTQYPFRLAWAITIHKSQGKTFDQVVIDIGTGTFAAGQMYVALSRCTSFEGVILKTPVRSYHIRSDSRIFDFFNKQNAVPEIATPLIIDDAVSNSVRFIRGVIEQKGRIEIRYLKANDDETTRIVIPLTVGEARYQGQPYQGMRAHCTKRDEPRMFRVDRILAMRQVE